MYGDREKDTLAKLCDLSSNSLNFVMNDLWTIRIWKRIVNGVRNNATYGGMFTQTTR